MRTLVVLSFVGFLAMVSCSSGATYSSAPHTQGIQSQITSYNIVDLDIEPERTSYTYYPSKRNAKYCSPETLESYAQNALLEKCNGDVLVEPRFNASLSRKGLVKSMTINGYVARYKNIH